ncbi:hypothetical protein Agub_g554 [Astrephomene gubernaculifera]|uniref:Chitin-binding type-2 domain-containing protein n=1 Tax=Astrephomene gubernaculifera TaxID=47775 RepID=A0AAD3DDW5_9CHLO|nr:hypothetical protein Agub_g554 [Astrephomene gubernaculifera]
MGLCLLHTPLARNSCAKLFRQRLLAPTAPPLIYYSKTWSGAPSQPKGNRMTRLLLLAAVLVASLAASNADAGNFTIEATSRRALRQASCTSWCAGKASGLYANPCDTTCNSFFNCANGVTNKVNCAAGLRFNPSIKVCDWASNVPCSGGSPSPSPKASPSPSPKASPSPSPKASPSPSPKASPSPNNGGSVLYSGSGSGTYYFDIKTTCPSEPRGYPETDGYPSCASWTPGPNQQTLRQVNTNNVVAIDNNVLSANRAKLCGKKVLVYRNGVQVKAPDGGDFFVWDGCAACIGGGRIDFSVSGLKSVSADGCNQGVVPGVSWQVVDVQVRQFVP